MAVDGEAQDEEQTTDTEGSGTGDSSWWDYIYSPTSDVGPDHGDGSSAALDQPGQEQEELKPGESGEWGAWLPSTSTVVSVGFVGTGLVGLFFVGPLVGLLGTGAGVTFYATVVAGDPAVDEDDGSVEDDAKSEPDEPTIAAVTGPQAVDGCALDSPGAAPESGPGGVPPKAGLLGRGRWAAAALPRCFPTLLRSAAPAPAAEPAAAATASSSAASCCGAGLAKLGRRRIPPPVAEPSLRCETSQEVLKRHAREADWSPTLLLYDTALDPPRPAAVAAASVATDANAAGAGSAGESAAESAGAGVLPRRGWHIPLNGQGAEHIENEHFVGCLVWMHRPPDDSLPCPHRSYFATRTRRWELRMQGRFRRKPNGRLFVGCVLQDFDYSEPLSWFSTMLGGLSLAPLERLLGADLHFTFGDRCEAAVGEDAELAHIVGELAVFDQLIVTPAGDEPPPPHGDLSGLGISRAGTGGAEAWASATRAVAASIDCEQTYTFCFWSAARFIDLLGDRLVNLIPLMPAVSLQSNILGPWPPHFVLYCLQEEEKETAEQDGAAAAGGEGEGAADGACGGSRPEGCPRKHLERRKSYFVDLMVCNERTARHAELCNRYQLSDACAPSSAAVAGTPSSAAAAT